MRNTATKILIVETTTLVENRLGGLSKVLGYEVFEATTGLEAIDRASSLHPDLIMMDLRLPEERVHPTHTRSHKYLLDYCLQRWRRATRALDAGAAEILYKSFHLTMLRDVLRTYLLA
jgi:DNA-binding response OmpR family regulator